MTALARPQAQLGQPRLEPGQIHSWPYCSMLCRAGPSLAKTDSWGSVAIFTFFAVLSKCQMTVRKKKKEKKTGEKKKMTDWADEKCSRHLCLLHWCMLNGDCVCMCVCVHAHVLYLSICELACVCVHACAGSLWHQCVFMLFKNVFAPPDRRK